MTLIKELIDLHIELDELVLLVQDCPIDLVVDLAVRIRVTDACDEELVLKVSLLADIRRVREVTDYRNELSIKF